MLMVTTYNRSFKRHLQNPKRKVRGTVPTKAYYSKTNIIEQVLVYGSGLPQPDRAPWCWLKTECCLSNTEIEKSGSKTL